MRSLVSFQDFGNVVVFGCWSKIGPAVTDTLVCRIRDVYLQVANATFFNAFGCADFFAVDRSTWLMSSGWVWRVSGRVGDRIFCGGVVCALTKRAIVHRGRWTSTVFLPLWDHVEQCPP